MIWALTRHPLAGGLFALLVSHPVYPLSLRSGSSCSPHLRLGGPLASQGDHVRQLAAQHLDRTPDPGLDAFRAPHRAHTALADLLMQQMMAPYTLRGHRRDLGQIIRGRHPDTKPKPRPKDLQKIGIYAAVVAKTSDACSASHPSGQAGIRPAPERDYGLIDREAIALGRLQAGCRTNDTVDIRHYPAAAQLGACGSSRAHAGRTS
jgi:hypothetical protein